VYFAGKYSNFFIFKKRLLKIGQYFTYFQKTYGQAFNHSKKSCYLSCQIGLRMRLYTLLICLLAFSFPNLRAQTILYAEDFNQCLLPPGWEVNISGNPTPTWSVGFSTNSNAPGQSIDSTCCLIIDDDAEGDNTPAYIIDFVSPAFNATTFPTVLLEMDVHYRDWGQAQEHFDVLVTDGTNEYLLARYDETRTNGALLSDHFNFSYDLSLLNPQGDFRIILRYDDAAGYAWWAAVDNIRVTGSGTATNVVIETFNNCGKPSGWETEILSGNENWRFGLIDTASQAYSNGTSMDGTCFAYFDDDLVGSTAPYSTVRLYSPWFDGSQFARFTLDFDLILRVYSEQVSVFVQHANNDEFLVNSFAEDIGGPYFPNYEHQTLDLSPYRNTQMRVAIEFSDGNDWGWWAGVDNIKIAGEGAANDLCTNALPLLTGDDCKEGQNTNAILDGPPAACGDRSVGGLWYRYQPDASGWVNIQTHAGFNDIVEVFTGTCATPQPVACSNRDEHGFAGDNLYLNAHNGTEYLIRVSGNEGRFGLPRGNLCIEVDASGPPPTAPVHDECLGALPLQINQPCTPSTNRNASTSTYQPSLNELARADVWFTFPAPAPLQPGEQLQVRSQADFSDIITLYSGSCNSLTEVAGNHLGGSLELPELMPGATYWIQIAGNFATVEGNFCPQILKTIQDAPANDDCFSALQLTIDGGCVEGNNTASQFSGWTPSCVPTVARDVWFSFTAPASGGIRVNSGADFEHLLGVWQGLDCNNLQIMGCNTNPLRCNGYWSISNLTPGQTYFLQLAVTSQHVNGSYCLSILDINSAPTFEPLALQVAALCTGSGTALLQANISGGTAPLTLSGDPLGIDLPGDTPFLVIVQDANGCEQSVSGIVDACDQSNCALGAMLVGTVPDCPGTPTGSITVNTQGGIEPYSFLWSNGSTESALYNVPAGAYSVSISDAQNCATTANITVGDPLPLSIVAENIMNPTQGQSNGAVTVSVVGGTGNYTFTWYLNQQVFQSGAQNLVSAPAGDYELLVTDEKGCTSLFPVTLTGSVSTGNPGAPDFSAYLAPNPAYNQSRLFLNLSEYLPAYVSISDALGRQIMVFEAPSAMQHSIILPVADLPGGVYLVTILAGDQLQKRMQLVVAR